LGHMGIDHGGLHAANADIQLFPFLSRSLYEVYN